jgi:hypothetical protein
MDIEFTLFAAADDFDVKEPPSDVFCFFRPMILEANFQGREAIARCRLFVCSPSGLERYLREDKQGLWFGRGLVLMKEYRYSLLERAISDWFRNAAIKDWQEWDLTAGTWLIDDSENLDLAYPRTLSWMTRLMP